MWDVLRDNPLTAFLLVAFFATLIYALRLRAKMASVSKAQFAFAACATLASLF
jgi:hypothetical protein